MNVFGQILLKRFYLTICHTVNRLYQCVIHVITRYAHDRVIRIGTRIVAGRFWNRWQIILDRLGITARIHSVYEAETHQILIRFPGAGLAAGNPEAANRMGFCDAWFDSNPADWHQRSFRYLESGQARCVNHPPLPISFSIVIPFFKHLTFFSQCLAALSTAIGHAPKIPVEVIIVNDDPDIPIHCIHKIIPECTRYLCRIVDNPIQTGISRSLNTAIQHAGHTWMVFLDCDDLLIPDALKILAKRIRQLPHTRYISSRIIDVDESGNPLRYRLRHESPTDLVSTGMVAGHLKAIRRDLFQDIGYHDIRFDGCQDYEFALRTAMMEPLTLIPDYLYKYRWHGQTQSVFQALRQANTTRQIQEIYGMAAILLNPPDGPLPFDMVFTCTNAAEWQKAFLKWKINPNGHFHIINHVGVPFTDIQGKRFAIHLSARLCMLPKAFENDTLEIDYPQLQQNMID